MAYKYKTSTQREAKKQTNKQGVGKGWVSVLEEFKSQFEVCQLFKDQVRTGPTAKISLSSTFHFSGGTDPRAEGPLS